VDPALEHLASRSLWLDGVRGSLVARNPLPGDSEADVAVVGAGFTGLWTALALLEREPTLRVVVIDRHHVGYGASGRNGGWASALFAGSRDRMARLGGPGAVLAHHRAMVDAISDIERTCAAERIDARFHRGGTLTVSRNPAQDRRVRGGVDDDRRWGLSPADSTLLDATACDERVRIAGTRMGAFTPHCARIDPARLALGLARAVEAHGARIHDGTTALEIEPARIVTDRGTIRAGTVVLATEAWSATLPTRRRSIVPIYSLMVATEPLPTEFWDEVGWSGAETITDGRRLIVYAQRTADDRIAFGGRGAPYHFASRIEPRFDREPRTFDALQTALVEMFPAARHATITHRWGGPLGVPRDWESSVAITEDRRFARAGGYVGDGVTTTNLAGRTIADLILGLDTERTRLPWVGHRSRRWEPEPLRWIGVRSMGRLARSADAHEARGGREARLRGRLLDALTGH
jgi:glycine/D-amino acid oxidase-like deaminating enzyme